MENNKNNLIPQKQTKLPENVKNKLIKSGKIMKYLLFTTGLGLATAGTIAVAPILSVPAIVGLAYNGQKLLNNILYKTYPDLAFITRKVNGLVTICQDVTRIDIAKEIKNYTDIEKAGFMQLQTIIGMTKFNHSEQKKTLIFKTLSHGITRKTFKKLRDLGYIESYQETYQKDSRLILPKIAFGNWKGFKNKVEMYHIYFTLTNKELDITDPNLQKAFPMVFGKRGLIQKRGYEMIPDGEGGLTYKVDPNYQRTSLDNKYYQNNLKDRLKEKEVPNYEQQAEISYALTSKKMETKTNTEEDKQL